MEIEIITNLTKEQFEIKDYPIIFQDNDANNKYALWGNVSKFRLAWNSDTIEPSVIKIAENKYGIGIDQNFAIIDFLENKILFRIELFYNFYSSELINDRFFLVTELEIIELDILSPEIKVLNSYDLTDFFEGFIIEDDNLKVKCVDENIIEL